MDAFLKENELDHLCDVLGTFSLQDSLAILDEGRPKLLEKLKELGVAKIPDRQKVAKALSTQRRSILGTGAPVLVCLYSAGVNKTTGRQLMSKLLGACERAGLKDQMVLDHHNEPPNDAHTSYEAYVDALHAAVVAEKPERATRPWVLVTHSHGSTGAYGLARKLQAKVRALVVIGRRAAHVELLQDVFGVPTSAAVGQMPLHNIAQILADVYVNETLKHGTANPDESSWAASFVEVAKIVRDQYSSPCSLCAADTIAEVIGDPSEALPSSSRLTAPILAIVSTQETRQGETREKVARWRELTSSKFALEAVDCEHMAMPSDDRVIKMVLEFLQPAIAETTG